MKSGRLLAVYVVLAVTCFVVAMLPVNYVAKAESPGSDWVGGQLKFEKATDYNYQPDDSYELFPNIPSQNIKASRNTNNNTIIQNLVTETHQVTPTGTGYFSSSHVLPFGESRWQKLDLGIFDSTFFYPNPSDSGLLAQMYYNSYYNNDKKFVRYISDWRQVFGKYSADGGGNVTRYVVNGYDLNASTTTLLNPDGSKMIASRSVQPSFSKNGKWAFLHTPAGDLRAEVPSLKYRVLAPVWNDRGMVVSSAVSNSGRFVAVGGVSTELRIYDTESCSNDTAGDCKNRTNMTQFVKGEYVKSLGAEHSPVEVFNLRGVKFVNESKLEIYFEVVFSDKTLKYEKLFVGVDPGPQTTRYLAMGDSFSSGEGAGDYYESTDFYADENNHNKCHQSRQAYSEILNKVLSPEWYDSIACSGAMMKDISFMNEDKDYLLYGDPQARSLNSDDELFIRSVKRNLLPGYISQDSVLFANNFNEITISIGGNDIGFGNIVLACIWQPGCYSNRDEREKLADLIAYKIPHLTKTYEAVLENMLGPDKKLYVIGYPQLFNEYNSCGSFMDVKERSFANHLVDYLNSAIKIASANAGARFISMSDAFVDYDSGKDYRLCGGSAVAANGLDVDKLSSSADQTLDYYFSGSYHPNKLGHALMAKRINLYTNGLRLEMPKKTLVSMVPSVDIYTKLVGDSEDKVNVQGMAYGRLTDTRINVSGDRIGINYNIVGVPASGSVDASLHSTPIYLGSVTPSEGGFVKAEFYIPEDIESGVHELHLTYEDISGVSHDIYDYIAILHSREDFDGDGIENREEVCAIGGVMDVDMDDDGVDDACDIDIVSTDKESVVVNGGIRKIDDTNTITTDLGIDDKSGNSGDEIMASGLTAQSGYEEYNHKESHNKSELREKTQPAIDSSILYIIGSLVLIIGSAIYFFYKRKRLGF